jgi:hypothetical protein
MTLRNHLSLALVTTALLGGCAVDAGFPEPEPEGPIATNATEAWPARPAVPSLDVESMTRACAAWAACALEDAETRSQIDGAAAVSLCLYQLEWSAERAIPISKLWISAFPDADERVEFFTSCVLEAQSCGALAACLTPRRVDMTCEEDGCRANRGYQVSCAGEIAILTPEDGPAFSRDCSRAFAACDPASPTGCTDRGFTACPEPPPTPDRCDGNVRLGCDGRQQVSYRDCTRLGGTCDAASGDCRYAEESCETGAACDSDQLTACVRGMRVAIEAPALCSTS